MSHTQPPFGAWLPCRSGRFEPYSRILGPIRPDGSAPGGPAGRSHLKTNPTEVLMARAPGTWLLAIVLALVTAVPSAAQSGGLAGKVTAADGGKPVADAVVTVQLANGAIVARGSTHADGSYRLLSVAAGTYLVRVSAIGYTPREFPGPRRGGGQLPAAGGGGGPLRGGGGGHRLPPPRVPRAPRCRGGSRLGQRGPRGT